MASSKMTQSGFNKVLSQCFGTTNVGQFRYFAIGTTSTAASTADTGLKGTETSWTVGAASFKDYVTTYPQFDTGNETVTLRGFVTAAEATGVVIYEYCDLTSDATKVPAARFVWTDPITKTTSNQLSIITVYKRKT